MNIKTLQTGCIISRDRGFAYSIIINKNIYWESLKTYDSESQARRACEDQMKRMDVKLHLKPAINLHA